VSGGNGYLVVAITSWANAAKLSTPSRMSSDREQPSTDAASAMVIAWAGEQRKLIGAGGLEVAGIACRTLLIQANAHFYERRTTWYAIFHLILIWKAGKKKALQMQGGGLTLNHTVQSSQ